MSKRSYHGTTQNDNTLPGLAGVRKGVVVGTVVAGRVVRGGAVNAGVVVAPELQVSNDDDGKRCCRIGNR